MSAEERTSHHRDDLTDQHTFIDGLAMALANGTLSRGQALKYAGVALLGGALGIFGFASPADARRRRRRRSGCASCSIPNFATYEGNCCLMGLAGGTSGCVVPSSVCDPPPSGTQCACCPVLCPSGTISRCCPASSPVCCASGSLTDCCPAGTTCTVAGCV